MVVEWIKMSDTRELERLQPYNKVTNQHYCVTKTKRATERNIHFNPNISARLSPLRIERFRYESLLELKTFHHWFP